jgi:D-arabinose 1-dehydrogenase-like Zn-dependent alcohol dehydrogenase
MSKKVFGMRKGSLVTRSARPALCPPDCNRIREPTPDNPLNPIPLDTSAVVPYWGNHQDLVEVVALSRAGHIKAETQIFPLADVAEAYAKLDRGEVRGRAVMVP